MKHLNRISQSVPPKKRHKRHTCHGVTKQASCSALASQLYSMKSKCMMLVTLVTPFLNGVWKYIISVMLSVIDRLGKRHNGRTVPVPARATHAEW